MPVKRLYRSENERMIAGICGGLGEMFSIDPTLIRLAVVLLGILTGFLPFLIAYGIGWIIIPSERDIKT